MATVACSYIRFISIAMFYQSESGYNNSCSTSIMLVAITDVQKYSKIFNTAMFNPVAR